MTVSDEDRRDLFEGLAEVLDRKRANTMMELLPPVGWSDVARRGDIAELRGEMAELRGEMGGIQVRVGGEIAQLRAGLTSEMADFRISMMRTVIVANIASMMGVATLVLAAVAIA